MLHSRSVPARKMQKIGFAVSFIVAMVGAVLLLISQIPLTKEGYNVVETRSFSSGEPLTFYFTFETNVKYLFEVKAANWPNRSSYFHYVNEGGSTYASSEGVLIGQAIVENPSSWNSSDTGTTVTQTLNVTFWRYDENGQETDQVFGPTLVEVSALRQTTYRLTYLIYVGLLLLIVGVILVTITGKDVDSRMRIPDASARLFGAYSSCTR